MSKFSEYIGSQFGNPRGPVGAICCMIMNRINRAMYQSVLDALDLDGQSKVLDVGYGNGYLIRKLYGRFHCYLYGIDISEDMQSKARKKNQAAVCAERLTLLVGDCCQLGFENETFDAAASINTIYFWSDTETGLSELCRTLKPGGVFCNVVYTKEWLQKLSYTRTGFRFFEKEDLVLLGKKAGFSEVTVQDIAKGKSFLVLYRR